MPDPAPVVPCSAQSPCPERNELHVDLWGECFYVRDPAAAFREIARRELAKAREALEHAEPTPRPFTRDDTDDDATTS